MAYGEPMERSEAVRFLRAAYEMGYTFFDTAEVYVGKNADGSVSNNEELVGEALKSIRDKVVIATKFGLKAAGTGTSLMDSRPEAEVQNKELLAVLNRLAEEKDATSAQIFLVWMLCKNQQIVPIPRTTKVKRLQENAVAAVQSHLSAKKKRHTFVCLSMVYPIMKL